MNRNSSPPPRKPWPRWPRWLRVWCRRRAARRELRRGAALPLKEILSAVANDLGRASAAADVSRGHWQRIYEGSDLLRGLTPSRVRLVEVKLSMPLAFEGVAAAHAHDYGLTAAQIAEALPPALAVRERRELAARIHASLARERKHLLLNARLRADVEETALRVAPELRGQGGLAFEEIERIQEEFYERPLEAREARFVYKAAELKKVDPDHLIKVDVIIGLE